MERCGLCRREIPTEKEIRQHRRQLWVAWGLSLLVVAMIASLVTLGATDYLTIRAQLKIAQRHLAEWQKVQMVDALVDANERLKGRPAPAAARKDAQGK